MNGFQERLNELLKENQTNRAQLAKKIGVSSTTINGYFNDGYFPRLDIAIKIANTFDCSLNYLFGIDDTGDTPEICDLPFIKIFDNLLKERNLSVAKALKEMNLGEYDYYRWKKGQFPKTANLLIIAKYFGVSIDYLIGNLTR